MKKKKIGGVVVPNWMALLYIFLSCVLVPWTVNLGLSLPRFHLSNHWDVSWTGLDIGLIFTLLMTGIFAFRQSKWIVVTASTTGSLLLVDAWFDVMSEKQPRELREAIVLAVFVEIPLALMSYAVAAYTLHEKTK